MIYAYKCTQCEHEFDVTKHHSECSSPEQCTKCNSRSEKQYYPPQINTTVCHEEPEYNPGLGCIVKNKKERKELAKQMGMEEIGNEKTETVHKHFDNMRKEKRAYDV